MGVNKVTPCSQLASLGTVLFNITLSPFLVLPVWKGKKYSAAARLLYDKSPCGLLCDLLGVSKGNNWKSDQVWSLMKTGARRAPTVRIFNLTALKYFTRAGLFSLLLYTNHAPTLQCEILDIGISMGRMRGARLLPQYSYHLPYPLNKSFSKQPFSAQNYLKNCLDCSSDRTISSSCILNTEVDRFHQKPQGPVV